MIFQLYLVKMIYLSSYAFKEPVIFLPIVVLLLNKISSKFLLSTRLLAYSCHFPCQLKNGPMIFFCCIFHFLQTFFHLSMSVGTSALPVPSHWQALHVWPCTFHLRACTGNIRVGNMLVHKFCRLKIRPMHNIKNHVVLLLL